MPTRPRTVLLQLAVIGLLGGLAYSNTLHVPFVLDDVTQIVRSPFLGSYQHVLDPPSLPGFADMMRGATPPRYPSPARVVAYLTLSFNRQMGGLDVVGFHVVNVAIHLLNCLLVFALARSLLATPRCRDRQAGTAPSPSAEANLPFVAALLFAVHPLNTQAVTYVVQRMASLATLFFLASVLAFLRFRLASHRAGKAAWLLGCFASIFLAMNTKEIAFTVPVVIVLADLLFFPGPFLPRLAYGVPLVGTMLVIPWRMGFLNGLVSPSGAPGAAAAAFALPRETEEIGRLDYLLTQIRVSRSYLRLLLLPVGQSLDHPIRLSSSPWETEVLTSAATLTTLAGAAGAAIWTGIRRRVPLLLVGGFGIAWFFVTLSVESGLVPIRDLMVEHRAYLPSVGAILAFAAAGLWIADRLARRWPSAARVALLVFVAAALALTAATYARNEVWKDDERLWRDVVSKYPSAPRPRNSLGVVLDQKGRPVEAVPEFLAAIRMKPDYFDAHNNLGLAYLKLGRTSDGVREIQAAYSKGHYAAALDLLARGSAEAAVRELETAVHALPEFTDARLKLGEIYGAFGRFEDAAGQFRSAVALDPANPDARNLLGMALAEMGNCEEAVPAFREAMRLRSRWDAPHYNLAVCERRMGNTAGERAELRKALELNPAHDAARAALQRLDASRR